MTGHSHLMTNADHVDRHLGVPYMEHIKLLEARIAELESQLDRPMGTSQSSFRCLDSAEGWVL